MKLTDRRLWNFEAVMTLYAVLTTLALVGLEGIRPFPLKACLLFAYGWWAGGLAAWLLCRTWKFPTFTLALFGCSSAVFLSVTAIDGFDTFLLTLLWMPACGVLSFFCPFLLALLFRKTHS